MCFNKRIYTLRKLAYGAQSQIIMLLDQFFTDTSEEYQCILADFIVLLDNTREESDAN